MFATRIPWIEHFHAVVIKMVIVWHAINYLDGKISRRATHTNWKLQLRWVQIERLIFGDIWNNLIKPNCFCVNFQLTFHISSRFPRPFSVEFPQICDENYDSITRAGKIVTFIHFICFSLSHSKTTSGMFISLYDAVISCEWLLVFSGINVVNRGIESDLCERMSL